MNNDLKKFECRVKPDKLENGEQGWGVFLVNASGFSVATFQTRDEAESFAKDYPKMMVDYIEKAKAATADIDESTSTPEINYWASLVKQRFIAESNFNAMKFIDFKNHVDEALNTVSENGLVVKVVLPNGRFVNVKDVYGIDNDDASPELCIETT